MRQLGQLEAAVMERLWSWDRAATVREVLEDLQRDRRIAYTTVMTVMDNLHGKGIATRELDGRAYRYRPAQSREEHTAAIMEQVLSSSSNPRAALLHFVQQIPPEDLAQLRTMLDALGQDSEPRP
ncbi:MAG: BlaI/MecI/CopY family transcriptional regulator [Pseudonocardiaceae bacterium]